MKISRSVKIRAIAIAATLLVASLVGVVPASAAAGATAWKMSGDIGDYITGGQTYSYSDVDTNFSIQGTGSFVQISANKPDYSHTWTAQFYAPPGTNFTAGTTYVGAVRGSSQVAGVPGLDVFGDGRGCNTLKGTFTINEIEIDPMSGSVTRFAAHFVQHCEGMAPAARGAVYYNTTLQVAESSNITLALPASANRNQTFSVGGILQSNGTGIAGATVTVTRTNRYGTTSKDLVTDTNGSYSENDSLAVAADTTYTVSYAGSAAFDPSSSTATIHIIGVTPVLSISTDKKVYAYGKVAHITVHLGRTHTSRVVTVYAIRHGLGLRVPGLRVARAKVNSKGNVTVSYAMTRLTGFYASFDGDAVYGARRVGLSRSVTTKVIITMHGYSGKKGSTYLYGQVNPTFTVTVLPQRSGSCVAIESQYLLAGNWLPEASLSCLYTDAYSQVYVYHRGHQHGYKFRVRALTSAQPDLAGSGNSGWTTVAFK